MNELRLARLDAGRTILLCYYGPETDLANPTVVRAELPWGVEGVNYDTAKAAFFAEQDAAAALLGAYIAEKDAQIVVQLRTATPAQVRNFAANSPLLVSFNAAQRTVIGELLVAIGYALRARA
jgi:hypothetical protein